MKLLTQHEIQAVSGGFGSAFPLAVMAGMNDFSQRNTVYNAMCAYGIVGVLGGALIGLKEGAFASVVYGIICCPLSAGYGAAEAYIGYKIGSYFAYETKEA